MILPCSECRLLLEETPIRPFFVIDGAAGGPRADTRSAVTISLREVEAVLARKRPRIGQSSVKGTVGSGSNPRGERDRYHEKPALTARFSWYMLGV